MDAGTCGLIAALALCAGVIIGAIAMIWVLNFHP